MKNTKQTLKHEDTYVLVPIKKNNLALVASAPLMLEALEGARLQLLGILNDGVTMGAYAKIQHIEQVIAKAKGE